MSAPAYARPARRPGDEPDRQPRLFALPGGAEALPLPETAPQRPALAPVPSAAPPHPEASVAPAARTPDMAPSTAPSRPTEVIAPRAPRTLDSELRLAWTALTAGAPAACIRCGGRMEPHAHAPGGSCTSCGTPLD